MFSKIFLISTLVVSILAQYHYTSSPHEYSQHNAYQNIEVAPAITKYAVQSAPVYSAPHQVAIPVVENHGSQSASSYYSAPAQAYAAPVAKVALPVVAKYEAAPVHYAAAPAHHQEEYSHPKYEYEYGIEDHHTGDIHSQQEQRDGDHVVGQYSLHEADGTIRIVKYHDDGHGFHAVVERQGHPTEAPAVIKKVVAPIAIQAPHY